MSEPKPKRILTPEQLEKLKVARVKALEVRQKKALITKAEKFQKAKELDAKYRSVAGVEDTPKEAVQEVKPPAEEVKKPKEVKQRKVKKVIEVESDEESSESSSDEEYDFSAVKNKYKEKYKNKYDAKYGMMKQNPYFSNPQQDAFILAKHNLQSKVNNELKKAAFNSLFGS